MATFKKKNILITGARFFTALDLARSFRMAGHEVFVADSHKIHLCALSKCINKSFTIPSPRFAFEDFQARLKEIIIEYQIDMVVPIFEETLYLAKAKPNLPINCEIFCSPLAVLDKLHNKWLFHNLQKNLDIKTIPTIFIQSEEDLKNIDLTNDHVLKLCYSRGCFFLQKLTNDKPLPSIKIDKDNPYIAQQWVEGKKYCSYSVCRDGKVTAHAVYSNETQDASYCLNFESLEHEKILQWVKDFAKIMHLTGQFSFDFIEAADGSLFVIECNPRSTSGLHLMTADPNLSSAFIEDNHMTIIPPSGTKRQLAFGMLLYGWRRKGRNRTFKSFLKEYLTYRDVVYHKKDLKPFLLQALIFAGCCYYSLKYMLSLPKAFTHDLSCEEKIF